MQSTNTNVIVFTLTFDPISARTHDLLALEASTLTISPTMWFHENNNHLSYEITEYKKTTTFFFLSIEN
jgi:hypothetical protein